MGLAFVADTKYYYAGGQRITMRKGGALYYLLGDHLGSTSITLDASDNTKEAELRYYPYGGTRYTYGSTPTSFRYTGQRSEMDGIGLYYYKARWYDPYLQQ